MRLAGHEARMEARIRKWKVLVGNPEGKKPLRMSRPTWKGTVKTDLKESGWQFWTIFISFTIKTKLWILWVG